MVWGTVGCGRFSLDSSSLLLPGGFEGLSCRGEKGVDVGRFTTSNSFSSIERLLIEETDCHILSSLRGECALPFRLVVSGVIYYC